MNTYATGPGAAWQTRRDQRLLAESVPCPLCKAAEGERCRNIRDGSLVLQRQPAHLARLLAAEVPL